MMITKPAELAQLLLDASSATIWLRAREWASRCRSPVTRAIGHLQADACAGSGLENNHEV